MTRSHYSVLEGKMRHIVYSMSVMAASLLAMALPADRAMAALTYSNQLVSAQSNIYGAGLATPPGGGDLPPMFSLPASPGLLTFSGVTGTVSLNIGTGSNFNDADGVGAATATSFNTGSGGISGITAPNAGFLTGVFETNAPPGISAPSSLDFTLIGTNFTSLSPALYQTFFIGDGLTGDGSGSVQTFVVPAGATQLFLGISDATDYNTGDFNATFSVTSVPEPASFTLIGMGGFLMLRRRRA
jgi:hypothetical protein